MPRLIGQDNSVGGFEVKFLHAAHGVVENPFVHFLPLAIELFTYPGESQCFVVAIGEEEFDTANRTVQAAERIETRRER